MRISFKRQAARKSRSKRVRKKFLGACLSATLATAWAGSAEAKDIHLSITPTETISAGQVLFQVVNSSALGVFYLGTIPGGQTSVFDYLGYSDEIFNSTSLGFLFIGVHGPEDNLGLSIGVNSNSTIQNGESFAAAFPPVNGYSITEANLVNAVTLGYYGEYIYLPFLNQYADSVTIPYGAPGTIVNFTDASFGGTINVDVVPEPASWVLLVSAAGIITLLARGRREL